MVTSLFFTFVSILSAELPSSTDPSLVVTPSWNFFPQPFHPLLLNLYGLPLPLDSLNMDSSDPIDTHGATVAFLSLSNVTVAKAVQSVISHPVFAIGYIALLYFSYLVLQLFLSNTFLSPFRLLKRPPMQGFWFPIMGNLIEMQKDDPGQIQMRWTEKFGGIVVYRGLFGTPRMLISDPGALSYVLSNAYNFPKPAGTRSALSTILGDGVLTTEGQQHKYQRKLVNPTFNQSSVRAYTPLFHRHARALATVLEGLYESKDFCELSPAMEPRFEQLKKREMTSIVDVLHWISRTTLDVIGESAFSYDLKSLHHGESGSSIAQSFQEMMTRVGQLTLVERALLHLEQFSVFDGYRPLPTSFNKAAIGTQKTVEQVAGKMIDEHKTSGMETDSDLLQKILTLNEDPTVPSDQRMSRREVLGQLTTLILAGHETTSTGLTWALWALAHHPAIQTRLRQEIREVWTDASEDISFEELHDLAFLDRVTAEVMRLHPPVHSTNREPAQDAFIPLSTPIRQRDGRLLDRVPVKKGQALIISIVTYNRRKDIWGDDAMEFKPDRWLNLPDAVSRNGLPGGHLAFIAGPRNCVGSKFALTEFKVILAHLIRKFEFAPLPSDLAQIRSKQVVVTRPRIKGLENMGTQMPLRFKKVDE